MQAPFEKNFNKIVKDAFSETGKINNGDFYNIKEKYNEWETARLVGKEKEFLNNQNNSVFNKHDEIN
mgnify:CR=1 FL=1